MQKAPAPSPSPALLPPGTEVGSWRVVAWAGGGIHGAVYRAVPLGLQHAGPVALKLALLSRDPRFAREAELLSRLHHPSLPRLKDTGQWQHPSGTLHPFLVLDWVEGVPLYDWARLHHPSAWQVLQLLAQLARALQAVHAEGAVHRDVKGDNILVSRTDGRAVLTDLGSCRFPGVTTLTMETLPPGTPAYRSPEAGLFSLRFLREPQARYCAGPADDLFALGVTACRLLTGEYPEFSEPIKDEAGLWHLEAGVLPPASLLEPGVEPQLRALILRMLSERPEERGTAAQLAEALEQAAESTAPPGTMASLAVQSLPASLEAEIREAEQSPGTTGAAEPVSFRAHARRWGPWFATAAASLVLAVWAWRGSPGKSFEQPAVVQQEPAGIGQEDAGTVGLGEAASTPSTVVEAPEPFSPDWLAEDPLPKPLPGQTRPDAKGRCPHKWQVALNGGCWASLKGEREACESVLSGQMFKGTCYVPILPPGRHPTSNPGEQP